MAYYKIFLVKKETRAGGEGQAHEELRRQPERVKLGLAVATINYIMLHFVQEFQKQQPECSVSMEMCHTTKAIVIWVAYHRDKVLSPGAMNLLRIVQGEQNG